MTTMEQKNVHIYQQVLYSWNIKIKLLDSIQQFSSEFKTDPFLVAITYHHPIFHQVDLNQSLKMYTDLAAQNHSYAMNNLAFMYQYGQGVAVDCVKAIEWYERAIVLNNSCAMNRLALLYANGQDVAVNHVKAKELYERAVDLGNSSAMNNLASMYKNGEGVGIDYQKAIKLYERAIELKNPTAMNNLADMYERGQGVPINDKKAAELYERSVNLNNLYSCFKLASMYQWGQGANKNLCRALELYLLCKCTKHAEFIVDNCLNLQEKMNMFKICLKHDYHPEHIRIYVTTLTNMWFCDVVNGVYLHQKHPLYNRHVDGLIAKYM